MAQPNGLTHQGSFDPKNNSHHKTTRGDMLFSMFSTDKDKQTRDPHLPLHRGNRGAVFVEAMKRGGSFKNALVKNLMGHGAQVAPEQMPAAQALTKKLYASNMEYQQGGAKKFQKGFVVLTKDGILYVYETEKSCDAVKILNLEGSKLLDHEDDAHPMVSYIEVTTKVGNHTLKVNFKSENISHKKEFEQGVRRGKIEAETKKEAQFKPTQSAAQQETLHEPIDFKVTASVP